MGDFWLFVVNLIGTAIVSSGIVVFFAKRWFQLRLDQRLETHKQTLQHLTERLKHDLQKDFINAELKTKSLHQLYPELFEKLTRAHGAVGSLMGLTFGVDWDSLAESEMRRCLTSSEVNPEKIDALLAAVAADRSHGVKEIKGLPSPNGLRSGSRLVSRGKEFSATEGNLHFASHS